MKKFILLVLKIKYIRFFIPRVECAKKVLVIAGVSGSGKTNLINSLLNKSARYNLPNLPKNTIITSKHMLEARGFSFRKSLLHKNAIIHVEINPERDQRDVWEKYISLATEVDLILMTPRMKTLRKNLNARSEEENNRQYFEQKSLLYTENFLIEQNIQFVKKVLLINKKTNIFLFDQDKRELIEVNTKTVLKKIKIIYKEI